LNFRCGLIFLAVLLVAGCSATAPRPADPGSIIVDREQYLESIGNWGFSGRLALSDGKDGGSGRLDWAQEQAALQLEFSAALGRGAWQLDAGPGRAVLRTGKGETWHATDVGELVSRHVGWQVPMQALPYWIRGLAAPGSEAEMLTDELDLPQRLQQLGWQISYDRWGDDQRPAMPVRITAEKGDYSFKLAVRKWRLPESP
jgi:outer membrane lipoprotein LolB